MATNYHPTTDPATEAAANPATDADRVIREQTVVSDGQATTTAVEETTVVVPSAATLERRRLARTRRVIYTIVNTINIFLAIRFVLALLGANPDNAFAAFIYTVTAPFALPFAGLFGPEGGPAFGVNVIEVSLLVAIAFYYLIAWIATKVAQLIYLRARTEATSGDPALR